MSLNDHMALLLKEPTRERVRERLLHTVHPRNADLITEELIDVRLALYQRPETNKAMTSYYAHPTTFSVTEEEIARVQLPVLVMANDLTGQSIAGPERLASLIPGARFTVLPQTGLWSHWESPGAFNETVLRFILEPVL
jgi:pimeloyl-ACP methyl ester carboxylesterase